MSFRNFVIFLVLLINLFVIQNILLATNLGSGAYSDSIPSSGYTPTIYKTANLNGKPNPSNEWYSSLLYTQYSKNMYAFPLCFKADNEGLIIGTPDYVTADSSGSTALFQTHLKVAAYSGNTSQVILSSATKVSNFSDWTVSAKWEDSNDNTKAINATMGQGLLFTYFTFDGDVKPEIVFPAAFDKGAFYIYDNQDLSNVVGATNYTHGVYGNVRKIITNSLVIKVSMDTNGSTSTWEDHFYGLFLPEGTTVYAANYNNSGEYGYHRIIIDLPTDKKYLSIGLMKSALDLNTWKNYAYNFVVDTNISWNIDETNSNVTNTYSLTTDDIRTTALNDGGDTLIALMPHHYKNAKNITYLPQTFNTLRGALKTFTGKSFQTELNFNGIMPFFDDNGAYDKNTLKQYMQDDKAILLDQVDLYLFSKQASNVANIIRIADKLNETETKTYYINKLKTALTDWLTHTSTKSNKYFYYHNTLNSLIEYPSYYGAERVNDHHYHYGYFIYAAAILASYDNDFKNNYADMIEVLIKDFACLDRNDTKFPFLRSFSIYEGHSWANGLDDVNNTNSFGAEGVDQESSSEAMNAWAGIYLWGLFKGDDNYKNLGIFGYATENSAITNYWNNTNSEVYPIGYDKASIGILFGNKMIYGTWFGGRAEYVYGIQMLPLNPSSLYLAYNSQYVNANYNSFISHTTAGASTWKDIFIQYQSLINPSLALSNYSQSIASNSLDYESTSKSFLYYWLNTMKNFGKLDTSIYADNSSFGVFDNNGQKTYLAYNATPTVKRVSFKNRINNISLGVLDVLPYSVAVSTELIDINFKIDKDTEVALGDGTKIFIPNGSFLEKVNISITNKSSLDSIILSANEKIKNTNIKNFAVNSGVFREFTATNLNNVKITKLNKNITISIPYKDDNNDSFIDGTNASIYNLRVVYLNELTKEWETINNFSIDYSKKLISSTVNHLSIFGVINTVNVSNLNNINVYPNPCYILSDKSIKIDNLPSNPNVLDINIYDLRGKLIKEFKKSDLVMDYNSSYVTWDGKINDGSKAASGIYIAFIHTEFGDAKQKLALIW